MDSLRKDNKSKASKPDNIYHIKILFIEIHRNTWKYMEIHGLLDKRCLLSHSKVCALDSSVSSLPVAEYWTRINVQTL